MKRTVAIVAGVLSLFILSAVQAAPITYTFSPLDGSGQADINDLDHTKYYVWQISNFSLGANEFITGATLTFTNIYDWRNETGDALYTHLLDSTPAWSLSTIKTVSNVDADGAAGSATYNTKLLQGIDSEGGGDKFATTGAILNTKITPVWSDPVGGLPANTVVYDFSHLGGKVDASGNIVPGTVNILSTLESYISAGNNFSFGFDPDCHYYNEKVTFTITTDTHAVPEPGTLLLLGSGLMGLGLLRRKKLTRP